MQQQLKNKTSIYIGVHWHRDNKKWQASLMHKKNLYQGGHFDNEEQAAMKVNLFCDKFGIERKNPSINIQPDTIQQKIKSAMYRSKVKHIVDKKVKLEDEKVKLEDKNILFGFKNECENHFLQSKDEEKNLATRLDQKSQKRKRTEYSIINADVIEEKMEIVNTYQ